MKAVSNILILIMLFAAPAAFADTSDYIWNEQFKKKLVEAETGNTKAMYEVGKMYEKGKGTDVNQPEALRWFEQAGKKGHAKAQYKAGRMYLRGSGAKKSPTRAREWLAKSADQGYGPAQFYLGRLYQAGEGVKQDNAKALEWYQKSETSGYSPAKQAVAKVREDIKRSEAQQSRASAAPAPAPAKKAAAKAPAKKSSGGIDVLAELKDSRWSSNGLPADVLPSNYTSCRYDKDSITCLSQEIAQPGDDVDILYLTEAVIGKAGKAPNFEINYRKKITDVVAVEPDDPDVEIPDIKKGWQKDRTVLRCSFKNRDLISCRSDKNVVQAYTRQ